METLSTQLIARGVSGNRCWLSLQERTVRDAAGKPHRYFFASRDENPPTASEKRPDAVVIVGFVGQGDERRLVMTDEYRIPLGRREIGFPAGLIDKKDYEQGNGSIRQAACNAAIREFKEETGLEFTPIEVSPYNLYSSAGLTDESVCVVIGVAEGTPSKEFLEEHEDIHSMILARAEIIAMMDDQTLAFGKIAWPFLWSIKHHGFPKFPGE